MLSAENKPFQSEAGGRGQKGMVTRSPDSETSFFFFFFFLRFYLFIFSERGKEGEREGKKHPCVVASHAPATGDLDRHSIL